MPGGARRGRDRSLPPRRIPLFRRNGICCKVAIILEALNIPYTTTFVDFTAVKQEPYTAVNPNGRLPALTNLNANLTLWESGAIVQYLIDTYDAEKYSLSYESFPGRYLTQQWLHFQMSGQGPYYGQLGWFKRQNDPQTQALAIKRYSDEIHRVTSVLDEAANQLGDDFPNVTAWMERMKARPEVAKVMREKQEALAAMMAQGN
ncbi:hypothetical protein N7497_006127 [Penicillium chrysogenum]|nr:hypothetical protein N7497_006127 [Penicillium chrysogenum]